jgi:hypothetical protein
MSLEFGKALVAFGESRQRFRDLKILGGLPILRRAPWDMSRVTVDCRDPHWTQHLRAQLANGNEANLIHFRYESHGSQCWLLGREFGLEFLLDRDPDAQAAQFRLRPRGVSSGSFGPLSR